jgi:hypothetical protein
MKQSARIAGLAVLATVGMPDVPGVISNQADAQMKWLTPHLESQRHHNIRRHQQRLHEQRLQRQGTGTAQDQPRRPPVSPGPDPVRREQLKRQLEPEYHRRVQLYGKASADDWLRRTAWQLGVEEGRRARQRAENQ